MSFKIEGLSAFVQTGDDDEEGIIAYLIDGTWMPLIMADEERLVSMRPYAEHTARLTGRPVKHIRFTGPAVVVEVIEP